MRPSKSASRSALMVLTAAAPPAPGIRTVMAMVCPPSPSRLLPALRQLVPQAVGEGAALRALREDPVVLQRAPEGAVRLAVPQLREGLLPDVAERGVDRAGVDLAVGVHPRRLPR